MRNPHTERPDEGLDLPRMSILVDEIFAAARTLYEMYPDRGAVEPLYRSLDDALRELRQELDRAARGGT